MVLSAELALVCACFLSLCELVLNHLGEELLGLDEGYLNVAVRISLEEELLLDALRKDIEYLESVCRKASLDELILSVPIRKSIELLCLLASEELVDLSDESGELRYELYDTLRDDGNTEVVAVSCSLLNRVSDLVCDVSERHLLSCNFLTDEADVRLCLKCALKSNVGSGTSHNLDEVPILLCGVSISLDVADELGICLCSCIETE